MAQPQQQFNVNDLIAQSLGQIQQNNQFVGSVGNQGQPGTGLFGRIQNRQDHGLLKNLLGALAGAGIGAAAARFDDSVDRGAGALFGGLAGGLLTRKIRQGNRQNDFSNITGLQNSSQNMANRLLEQLGARNTGNAIVESRQERGLPRLQNVPFGVSDNTANILTNSVSDDNLNAAIEVLNAAQSGGFNRGLSTGSGQAAGGNVQSPVSTGPDTIASNPANVIAEPTLDVDPTVQPAVLRGGVGQDRVANSAGFSRSVPPQFANEVLRQIGSVGNTGLTQGVEGSRVPSQNRRDDAVAQKTDTERDFIPFEAQSRRTSANASAANASANQTRANVSQQLAPSQQQLNESRSGFYSAPARAL